MPIGEVITFPQPSPIPAPAAWGAVTTQSSFSNTANQEPVAPYQTAPDTIGCFYDIPNLVTLAAGANYLIPYGLGWLLTGATVNSAVVQALFAAGWLTIKTLQANDSWFYQSDYSNLRILNGLVGTTIITLVPKRKR